MLLGSATVNSMKTKNMYRVYYNGMNKKSFPTRQEAFAFIVTNNLFEDAEIVDMSDTAEDDLLLPA